MLERLHSASRQHPIVLFSAGCGLMALSLVLMFAHIHTIIMVRDVSVPIVGQLPQLEHQLQALQDQMELTELSTATRIGSQQEKIEMYALPKETNVSRTVATFEVLRDVLSRDGMLSSMSDLTFGEPTKRDDGVTTLPVSVDFVVHQDGFSAIELLLQLSGRLTIGDILTEEEVALLIDRIEQENPSGIVALEQFLSADLMKYAENPKAYEEQLKRSFSSSMFLNTFDSILRTSLLRDVRQVLHSDLGQALVTYKLWPMQMMAVEELSLRPGSAPKWYTVGLTALVLSEE